MAKRLRLVGGILVMGVSIGTAIASCSSPDEKVGQSAAALSAPPDDGGGGLKAGPLTALTPQTNYQVTHGGYHELSVAGALHTDPQTGHQVGNWAMGFIPCGNFFAPDGGCPLSNDIGWAWTDGLTATIWNVGIDAGAFGDPCDGGQCMSDDATFSVGRADPYLATVTNPSTNESEAGVNIGPQVVYTMPAFSTLGNSDVMVSLSNNGGQSYNWSHLLSTSQTGTKVDNPTVASHLTTPYSIYATWSNGGPGYVSKVAYTGTAPTYTLGPVTPLPNAQIYTNGTNGNVYHPGIAMGEVTCGTTAHELAYITWADNVAGAGCPNTTDGSVPPNQTVNWYFAAYDTNNGADNSTAGPNNDGWWGPWLIDTDDSWPGCIGNEVDAGLVADNDVRPRIAAETSQPVIWVAYVKHSVEGTRVNLAQEGLVCTDNVITRVTGGPPPYVWPSWCYDPNTCSNSPADGGPPYNNSTGTWYTVNDQWGPAIAFAPAPSQRELVVTWYDTRKDPNNNLVTIWGGQAVGFTTDVYPYLSAAFQVGNVSDAGQTVPWNHLLNQWADYQALGMNSSTYTFLAGWGGDSRYGGGNDAGIWTAIIK
jgi:hypothetical protein